MSNLKSIKDLLLEVGLIANEAKLVFRCELEIMLLCAGINAERIVIVACGTSLAWSLSQLKIYFEGICRIPVEVEYASEFRYRNSNHFHEG